MRKVCVLFLALCCYTFTLQAQDSVKYFRCNLNFILQQENFSYSKYAGFTLSGIWPAYEIAKRQVITRYELSRIAFSNETKTYKMYSIKQFSTELALLYEKDFVPFFNKGWAVQPYLGGGISLRDKYSSARPSVDTLSRGHENDIMLQLLASLGIRWNITPRLNLDLAFPIPIVNFDYFNYRHYYESNPETVFKTSHFDVTPFSWDSFKPDGYEFRFKIGLGYRLY